MKPELILMCGLPGSGKTTLAKTLAEERSAIRLCTDEWQAGLGVDHSDEHFHDLLEDELWEFGKELLRHGQSIVFEKGLWLRSERDEKRREAEELGIDIELHVLDVPVDELVRRLESRNSEARREAAHVTGEQVREYATRFFQAPDAEELSLFSTVVIHSWPPSIETKV